MGRIVKVSTSAIRPTQPKLIVDAHWDRLVLRRIVHAYMDSRESEIPMPVAREHNGSFYTIEGHKRLAGADIFSGESLLYVPAGPLDTITEEKMDGYPVQKKDELSWANGLITSRWEKVIDEERLGICPRTLESMRKQVDYLSSVDAARAYFRREV